METEALKFRSNKMYEAQMFQGDKGPGKLDDVLKGYPFDLIFFSPSIGQVSVIFSFIRKIRKLFLIPLSFHKLDKKFPQKI